MPFAYFIEGHFTVCILNTNQAELWPRKKYPREFVCSLPSRSALSVRPKLPALVLPEILLTLVTTVPEWRLPPSGGVPPLTFCRCRKLRLKRWVRSRQVAVRKFLRSRQ